MPWTTEKILGIVGKAAPHDCITEQTLSRLSGLSAKQTENACDNLIAAGYLRRTGKDCHKLTEAGRQALAECVKLRSGPKGPETGHRARDPGLRQKVWNVLRIGKKKTIDDILMLIAKGDECDPRSNVRKYLTALVKTGYVIVMDKREAPMNPTSNGCLRYLLVRDTGPMAPVWRQSRRSVWDPNTETETPFQEAP